MRNFLQHFLLPHHTNNHRPKLLHHKTLLVVISVLLGLAFLGQSVPKEYPKVLGISANISAQDLLSLTNKKRLENGQAPLVLNDHLSVAAGKKADDMFGQNYWAHVAPDGTTPWVFIKKSGYDYLYAGENLARGFTTAPEVVDAWMKSPSHRENMLSANYKEIGFAIKPGSLTGSETILVVEMFGSPYIAQAEEEKDVVNGSQKDIVILAQLSPVPSSSLIPTAALPNHIPANETVPEPTSAHAVASIQNNPLVDTKSTGRNVAYLLIVLFIGVLILDLVIIQRKKIARVVSHNLDHIIFLLILLVAAILFGKGLIL